MPPTVTIIENGRDGHVHYSEGLLRTISGYWEFGGNDIVTIVSMGTRAEWQRTQAWALDQRASILRFVADEVIRMRAPSCTAEIDEEQGTILLRQAGGNTARASAPRSPTPQARSAAFVRRYSNLKAMLGTGVLVVALIVGGMLWIGKKTLMVAPASGVPLNECVRTETHIASLIQSTDPHLPEISGRGGNTTTSISILLIPLDGGEPKKILIAEGLTSNQYALAKILGSDGQVLWFDVNGTGGVDLERMEVLKPAEVRDPFVPKSTWPFAISPDTYYSAGFIVAPGKWFGLHSAEETQGGFAPKKFVRRVEAQESSERMRRFHRGTLDAPVDDKYHRILALEPIHGTEYFNAAFLRMDDKAEPIRLTDPDGALMIHTSEPGLKGTTIVSRVDLDGKVLWSVDTAIDRFKLTQVLPGKGSFAFVGTRIPVEGKLSEPLVVVVDNATGKVASHSLWR